MKTFSIALPAEAQKLENFIHSICDNYHWDKVIADVRIGGCDKNNVRELTLTIPD